MLCRNSRELCPECSSNRPSIIQVTSLLNVYFTTEYFEILFVISISDLSSATLNNVWRHLRHQHPLVNARKLVYFLVRSLLQLLLARCTPENGVLCFVVLEYSFFICGFQSNTSDVSKRPTSYKLQSGTTNELQTTSIINSKPLFFNFSTLC